AREMIHSLREATRALQNGELVCIFPEGQMTRIGQMMPFRRGMERILKGVDVPVIPVHIDGIWGSIFSFSGGKFFWKWPRKIPYPGARRLGPPLPPPLPPQRTPPVRARIGRRRFRAPQAADEDHSAVFCGHRAPSSLPFRHVRFPDAEA